MDDVRRGIEFDFAALAQEHDAAPLAGGADRRGARVFIRGTIDGPLHSVAAGETADLGDIIRTGGQRFVANA